MLAVYGIMCGLKRHLRGKNGDEALNPLAAYDKRYGIIYFGNSFTFYLK